MLGDAKNGEILCFIGGAWVMTTDLQEAMTAGVFVEIADGNGKLLGQAVFVPWQGRPLPAVGDKMTCNALCPESGRRVKLKGRVVSRHFELQHDEDGRPCVWARLSIEAVASSNRRQQLARFSPN